MLYSSFFVLFPSLLVSALFQSLLHQAVGRTINPVGGVVGLLWTGNWQLCQSAAETLLCGRSRSTHVVTPPPTQTTAPSQVSTISSPRGPSPRSSSNCRQRSSNATGSSSFKPTTFDLSLGSAIMPYRVHPRAKKRRATSPPQEDKTTASRSGQTCYSGLERI